MISTLKIRQEAPIPSNYNRKSTASHFLLSLHSPPMANPFPPSPSSQSSTLLLLFLQLLLLLTTSAADGVSSTANFQELEDMLEALRNHGYTLFTNAITTSDLQYQLLTTAAAAADEPGPTSRFTLFAPEDELLFALDMASDAAVYVSTLRYHVVPNHRHTFSDLQNLSSHFLDTLLPPYSVLIGKVQYGDVLFGNATVGVMVDGVRVSNPDLFLGSRIAVHGIDGILLTGLNMNQDFGGNDNGFLSGLFPPVESPANIPAEGTHAPMFQFDSNNVPAAPASTFDGNIPAGGTTPISDQFDWNNDPVAPASTLEGNIPAEGTLTPISDQFDWNNDPFDPASTFDGNIPAKGTLTTPTSQFDWNNVPPALESPLDGNIPVAAIPKILLDQIEKMKSLGKKKLGKHHRKGRRHHRRHHRLGDL